MRVRVGAAPGRGGAPGDGATRIPKCKKLEFVDCIDYAYCNWAVLGCTGLYWAVLGCTGLYWALLGLTRPYWALLGLNLHLRTNRQTDGRTLRLIALLSQPKR